MSDVLAQIIKTKHQEVALAKKSTPLGTLELRVRLVSVLGVMAEGGVVRGSFTARDPTGSSVVTVTQAPILGGLRIAIPLGDRVVGAATLAGGVTFGAARFVTLGQTDVGASDRGLVLGGHAGVELVAGRGRVVLEAGFLRARLPDAGLEGEVLGARLSAGYAFAF